MANIITRADKGSPLTNDEVDSNFINLDENKIEQTAADGAAIMPVGPTSTRPDPALEGHFRRNDEMKQWEGFDGNSWGSLGGASGGGGNPIIYENDQIATADYDITQDRHGMTAGPFAIADDVTVRVPDGSVWTIVSGAAAGTPYDNSVSGLIANNMQDAMDEIVASTQAAIDDLLAVVAGMSAFPPGTKLLFAQEAAPPKWVQIADDEANNRMLRVVSGVGGGVGGSHSPILNNVVPAHTHAGTSAGANADHNHWLRTGNVSADHTHGIADPGHAHAIRSGVANGGSWGTSPMTHQHDASGTNGAGVGVWTNGISANHTHDATTGDPNLNHTHGFSTDNGSSQTNWTPRYVDLILCEKDES